MKKLLDKKVIVTCLAFIVVLGIIWVTGENRIKNIISKKKLDPVNPAVVEETNFNLRVLKTVNSIAKGGNYLISPYSMEVALNMLKDGANGNTYKEIADLVGERKIEDITSDKVKVANALFIKNKYKSNVKNEFTNTLVSKYNSEILYDEFVKPNVINDWVNKNTDGMIKRVVDSMDSSFVLGLANAVAIDVEWLNEFECIDTRSGIWTNDGKETNVEMMHNSYKGYAKYFRNENEVGVVIPYEEYNGKSLEFVGILPTGDLSTYIDNLTKDVLDNIDVNTKEIKGNLELNLALPRFTYSYTLDGFVEVLQAMGMKDAFNPEKADFSNMVKGIDVYVSEAVHKTHIELSETGTKAAAVTYFGANEAAALPEEKEIITITFDKPFMYIIRDSKTKEMVFVGTVYEPNEWHGSTCDKVM